VSVWAVDDQSVRIWEVDSGTELGGFPSYNFLNRTQVTSHDGIRRLSTYTYLLGGTSSRRNVDLTEVTEDGGSKLLVEGAHQISISGLVFSPDDETLASASGDQTLKLWDAKTGTQLAVLSGHSGGVTTCAFSPDGKRLASASLDHTIRVWDAKAQGNSVQRASRSAPPTACAISPDCTRAVTVSENALTVWDLNDGVAITSKELVHFPTFSCGFSPDGTRIAAASIRFGKNELVVWDSSTGERVFTSPAHKRRIMKCAYSPDGSRLVTCSEDTTLKIWDAGTGAELFTLEGHRKIVADFAFSPDGRWIVSASADATLRIWDIGTGVELATLSGQFLPVRSCGFSPDGRRIVSAYTRLEVADRDKRPDEVKVWAVPECVEADALEVRGRVCWTCKYSPRGRKIAIAGGKKGESGEIGIWDPLNSGIALTFSGHRGLIRDCMWSPDGRLIFAASFETDGVVKVWDLETEKAAATFLAAGRIPAFAVSGNAQHLCVCDSSGGVYLLRLVNAPIEEHAGTPVHLYRAESLTFDSEPTVQCAACGKRFTPSEDALGFIRSPGEEPQTSTPMVPDQTPELLWDDSRLRSQCPHCNQPIVLNPFIIDNRDVNFREESHKHSSLSSSLFPASKQTAGLKSSIAVIPWWFGASVVVGSVMHAGWLDRITSAPILGGILCYPIFCLLYSRHAGAGKFKEKLSGILRTMLGASGLVLALGLICWPIEIAWDHAFAGALSMRWLWIVPKAFALTQVFPILILNLVLKKKQGITLFKVAHRTGVWLQILGLVLLLLPAVIYATLLLLLEFVAVAVTIWLAHPRFRIARKKL
jgi:WD40 repeat protein